MTNDHKRAERPAGRTSGPKKSFSGRDNAPARRDSLRRSTPSSGDSSKSGYQQFEYRPAVPFETESRKEQEQETYILTGRNPIREALKNHHDLEKLLVQRGELSGSAKEIVQKAKEQKVMIQVVDKSRLDDIAPHHQGLIAFASAYQYSTLEDILQTARDRNEDPFLILLDGITDPHNLGAIIRTAECAGAHGIIVPQHRSVGLSPSAVKASAGAVEYVKVARVGNMSRTIDLLKKNRIWVYAVTMNGIPYKQADFSGGVALVIGAEEDGISRLVAEKCDYSVSLPLVGKIESLNASVAAGIIMYQVLEARTH